MPKTLLVVDDAMIIRKIIKDTATSLGWEVVGEACNGQDAVQQYEKLGPDAVTLDIVMPEYDGMHGLRGIIKADPEARVIMVSAVEQKDVLKEAFKAGAADFVVKPFDKENLQHTLEQLVPESTG